MLILVMGVAGSGKTTLARTLAETIGFRYIEADGFHPPANKKKMAQSIPLTDEDRMPWLEAMRVEIAPAVRGETDMVLACSALKEKYRDILFQDGKQYRIIFLDGEKELLRQRIAERKDHFMPPTMIDSQMATLEPPLVSLRLDVRRRPEKLLESIVGYLFPDK